MEYQMVKRGALLSNCYKDDQQHIINSLDSSSYMYCFILKQNLMQLTGHQKADFSNVPFESGFPQGDEQADSFLQGHDVISALSRPLFYNTRPHYFLEVLYSFHFELNTNCIVCMYIYVHFEYTLLVHVTIFHYKGHGVFSLMHCKV